LKRFDTNENSAKGNMMKKLTPIFLTLFILSLTACSASRSNSSNFASLPQNGTSTGGLPVTTQIALGTLKLDKTANDVTADQAAQLLPLWETMQVLESSDTAAQQEIEALDAQIQETMTDQQRQAITAMNLTRQDMFSILQTQGTGNGNGRQANNTQGGNSSGNGNRNFTFGAGGPPDGGGFPGGQAFGGGQGQNRSASQIATAQAARQAGGGNRIPSPLISALIEFLKKKAGS
jgi:hypothetical protein